MMTPPRIDLRYWLLMGILLLTVATGAPAASIPLTATLTGAQETPPNSSPGSGSAAFILDDVDKILVSAVTFSGLTSPTVLDGSMTSAQIHLAPPGVAGPSIHPFPTAPIGVTSGSFTDIWTGLTAAQITALETGNTYINIDTMDFPDGEIRGRISVLIPEPGSLVPGATGAVALLGYGWLRRKGSRGVRRIFKFK